jgi:hypothetical protein
VFARGRWERERAAGVYGCLGGAGWLGRDPVAPGRPAGARPAPGWAPGPRAGAKVKGPDRGRRKRLLVQRPGRFWGPGGWKPPRRGPGRWAGRGVRPRAAAGPRLTIPVRHDRRPRPATIIPGHWPGSGTSAAPRSRSWWWLRRSAGSVRAREVGAREGGGGLRLFGRGRVVGARPGSSGAPRKRGTKMLRPKLELADIFRCHGEAWPPRANVR